MEPDQIAIVLCGLVKNNATTGGHFFWVWGALLVTTAIEVYLPTYQNMQPVRMLTIPMGLSLIKAALINGYFMHMKFEVSRMEVAHHSFPGGGAQL